MPYDDLRSFLDTLDKEGQLLRITDELSPEPDLAAAANAAARLGDGAGHESDTDTTLITIP